MVIPLGAPVLLFDGDCAFCSSCARWMERRISTTIPLLAWQLADLADLGVAQAEVDDAVVLVEVDGAHRLGPDAIAATLRASDRRAWQTVGRALGTRPILAIARPIYRLVARNRHRMPGGTPACALPHHERASSDGG